MTRRALLALALLSLACEPPDQHSSLSADAASAPSGTPADMSEWVTVPARPRTWDKDVQPILLEHCGPCHVGPAEQACVGGSCLSLFYDAFATYWTCCSEPYIVFTEEPASCESGQIPGRVWECGMKRIYSFVSQGKDPVPDEQVRTLEEWIEDGLRR